MKRERSLPRLITSADPGCSPSRTMVAALATSCVLLASACHPSVPATSAPTHESSLSSATSTHLIAFTPSPTSLAAFPSPVAAQGLEAACPVDGNLLDDGGFASDLEGWEARIGSLRHTLKTFAGEPGAALLVTSEASPDGGYLAVAGDCLDLDPATAIHGLRLEAYLLAMPETESAALSVFFHSQAGCRGEVLEAAGPPAAVPGSGWIFVSGLFPIPSGAAAADFVVRAVSQVDSGRALVDRVCAFLVPDPG